MKVSTFMKRIRNHPEFEKVTREGREEIIVSMKGYNLSIRRTRDEGWFMGVYITRSFDTLKGCANFIDLPEG